MSVVNFMAIHSIHVERNSTKNHKYEAHGGRQEQSVGQTERTRDTSLTNGYKTF